MLYYYIIVVQWLYLVVRNVICVILYSVIGGAI